MAARRGIGVGGSVRLVVGGALIESGRVLLARRGPGQSLSGCWEFPGGKVEPGESLEEALMREFREELGLEIDVGEPLGRGKGTAGLDWIDLRVFRVARRGGEPQARDRQTLGWFVAEQLGQLDWPPADRPVLPALRRALRESAPPTPPQR